MSGVLSGGTFQKATISRSELVAVVQEVHRLEGWSGGGDSEEEVQRIGEAVAEDPRGAAGMARFYLSILEELRHQEEGDEIVEWRRVK